MKKEKRQRLIKQVLREREIDTQEKLVELLAEKGEIVTQATISRDIRELNIIKTVSSNGLTIYKNLTGDNIQTDTMLKKKLGEVVVKVDYINQLTIIKTLPGNANVIGVLLDSLDWKEKVGCICGNDTCLVISKSQSDREILEERLKLIM
ncbi:MULTISPECIES: arginine repressor [Bacillus cereus group]|uniref:Arginine repressor n=1 Tax=Bacillus thuringiensis serovar mexicanensis TaxID=180868 RepID=A0A242VZJ4_BACTU|nr:MULTISPECIES: ArgR family transcriptional regulator [Bacillus cereus group]EEM59815.1 Arginine regulator [Bacillus thuringiensis serovar monterrey BGSC 4AJ1]MEB9670190.1 arginine repressor [Bacillus anthracis]OTW44593.1 arginine repressor [Bacillus thuringiensis serovar mexicanensis]OTW98748.1 arginine repressor [Bacillus thuringiensis serovar monterrey]